MRRGNLHMFGPPKGCHVIAGYVETLRKGGKTEHPMNMEVALFKVHLAAGFSFMNITGMTDAGPQFGMPGDEVNVLYIDGIEFALVVYGMGRTVRLAPQRGLASDIDSVCFSTYCGDSWDTLRNCAVVFQREVCG